MYISIINIESPAVFTAERSTQIIYKKPMTRSKVFDNKITNIQGDLGKLPD
jgi:hypothetical protein